MSLLVYVAALWLHLHQAPPLKPCPRSRPCASGGMCVRWADSVCKARGELPTRCYRDLMTETTCRAGMRRLRHWDVPR